MKAHRQNQNGSTSIQWIIVSLMLSFVLFTDITEKGSTAIVLEKTLKNKYKDQVYSGGLP